MRWKLAVGSLAAALATVSGGAPALADAIRSQVGDPAPAASSVLGPGPGLASPLSPAEIAAPFASPGPVATATTRGALAEGLRAGAPAEGLPGFDPGVATAVAAGVGIRPDLPNRVLSPTPQPSGSLTDALPPNGPETPIPEPASLVLLVTGIVGLTARRHLRRRGLGNLAPKPAEGAGTGA